MSYDSNGEFLWARGWGVLGQTNKYQTCYASNGMCYKGHKGSNLGQFNNPMGLAVSTQGSYLYIADTGNNRISKMSISDGLITNMTLPDGVNIYSYAPTAITTDENNVYLTSGTSVFMLKKPSVGSKFDEGWKADSSTHWPTGVALSKEKNILYVSEYGSTLEENKYSDKVSSYFTLNGSPATWQADIISAPLGGVEDIAVDKDENVYVADFGKKRIQIYKSNGEAGGYIGSGELGSPVAIAIAPPSAPSSGKVYIVDGSEIIVYAPAAAPEVTTEDASKIISTSARLNGSVDPGLAIGQYSFIYWKAGTTTTKEINMGSGKVAASIYTDVNTLDPNTTYNFRIKGVNKYFPSEVAYGVIKSFKTLSQSGQGEPPDDPAPVDAPDVDTMAASNIQSTSATLKGFVDPHNQQSQYYFSIWKTETSYPLTIPAGSGNSAKNISALATGLKPDTWYSFRAFAVNIGLGALVNGSVLTFKTEVASGAQSDDSGPGGGDQGSTPGGGQSTDPLWPGVGQTPGGATSSLLQGQNSCQESVYEASASTRLSISLRQLAGKSGVVLEVKSNRASSTSVTMSLSKKDARRAGIEGGGRLARTNTTVSGSKRLKLRLSKKLRKRLGSASKRKRLPAKVKVKIVTRVSEQAGKRAMKLSMTLVAKRKGKLARGWQKRSRSLKGTCS